MKARVLGSAAGGGFPQWNCNCPGCRAVRTGSNPAVARTQSSLAVRADGGAWHLVNASPDVRTQLEGLETEAADGLRRSPVATVVLTDAEIDHTAGLLVLREGEERLRVRATAAVRAALSDTYPLFRVLERYCGVAWSPLEADGSRVRLDDSLEVEAFAAGGDPPRYLRGTGTLAEPIGLTFLDREAQEGILTYVPGLARGDDEVRRRLAESDCVLVDGTFWSDDEMPSLGVGERTARDMGHLPLSGPGGTLELLETMRRPRKILVHINNTNPVLLEGSPERRAVESAGVEVAYDGLQVEI